MTAMFRYAQIRHVYDATGMWRPELAGTPSPPSASIRAPAAS
jgi:hypothetical protein